MRSIAVVGGNGFLGRKICEVGVRLGWSVSSLSRSGKPPQALTHADHLWIAKVQWQKADLFDPSSYASKIGDKTAVVHSAGLLLENVDYKLQINLNFSFLTDVKRLGTMLKGANPMARSPATSYAAVQRDLAVMLADTYTENYTGDGTPAFVYISADSKPPIIPDEYLTTKREAEFELACKEGLRAIFMRPGFMYDDNEPGTNNRRLLSRLLALGYDIKTGVFGDRVQMLNDLVRPATSTEKVALTLYDKLQQPGFEGVVPLEEINNF